MRQVICESDATLYTMHKDTFQQIVNAKLRQYLMDVVQLQDTKVAKSDLERVRADP